MNKFSRRDFLHGGLSAATLATLGLGAPRLTWGANEPVKPRAEAVILLWMAGGMAHTETFDPKEQTTYRPGIRQYGLRSTFPTINSVVDNIKLSAGLENIAKVMDRGTIVRSFTPPDLGHILHSRHQYHWHTGYSPPQTVETPHLGSTILKTLGSRNPDMPGFVHIGQRLDIEGAAEVQAFLTPGFLGGEFAPYLVTYAEQAYSVMNPPPGMTDFRFVNRNKLYQRLVQESPVGEYGSDYHKESMLRSMENSYRIMRSPSVASFNLSDEKKEVRDRYDTGNFGLGCLLARRLVERGVRFVEVTTEHVPFGNWDTHDNGSKRTVDMKKMVDAPIAQLILDLEERGLLDKTLVVIASEFSRHAAKDPDKRDPNDRTLMILKRSEYGLHRHFTGAGSLVFFGGGMKRGSVYGRTDDIAPCPTVENPASMMDIHATIFNALGIPPNMSYDVEKRPFYVTEDGKGKPIEALYA